MPTLERFIASILGIILVLTGWWQYLWVLFGGANQLMASLALMLVTAYLMSEGKACGLDLHPHDFHVLHDGGGPGLHILQSSRKGFYRSGERGGSDREHPDGPCWVLPGHRGHHPGHGKE